MKIKALTQHNTRRAPGGFVDNVGFAVVTLAVLVGLLMDAGVL